MRRIFLLAAILAFPLLIHAEGTTPDERFLNANQLFEKGEPDKAGEIYQALVSQGFQGAELYYNLGNLHYRKGERGKAVLWYERALRLNPRDPDIQFNLSLARSHIKDEDENIFRRIFMTFTGDELSCAMSFILWIFFGILGARTMGWIKSENWPGAALWLSGFSLALIAGWFGAAAAMEQEPMAVVITPPGEVRNGPGPDYAVGFTIPEGSNVQLLNRRPDWSQVGVPNQGLKGWMPNSEVEPIEITPASSN